MSRDSYIIVRIQHSIIPAIVSYVRDGASYASLREGARVYDRKQEAIKEARRLAGLPYMPGQYRVVNRQTSATVYDSYQEGNQS